MKSIKALTNTTILASFALAMHSAPSLAADDINPKELINLSLEQLSNIEVTSVSKKSEKASEAAAAIYVITQDDIRRSGMTSIPELLRMVPGLNVAQSGSHQWAVSSRGFNNQFSDKLLVLMDGRSVYTPIFSGVFWDTQDTPLQDIERIEVIRGPGATLWGANAVNGVINIITKQAKDTQGGFVSQTAGTFERSLTTVRNGVKMGEEGYVRTYAKYDEHNAANDINEKSARDAWNKAQGGFRADWKSGEKDSYTLQGDAYKASENYIFNLPLPAPAFSTVLNREDAIGGNILGRWEHKISEVSDFSLQSFYDNVRRSNIVYSANIHTFDLEAQHIWTGWQGHEIVSGVGYRMVDSNTDSTSGYITFKPTDHTNSLFSSFVQDKITILPEKLFLTLGTKLEHNAFSGAELEPSARFSWLVDEKQTIWGSVSRAIKSPNLATSDLQLVALPLGGGNMAVQVGNKDGVSEEVIAYELGHRIQPASDISFDTAVFFNDYSRLLLGSLQTPFALNLPFTGGFTAIPATILNAGSAQSYGLELSAKWNPTDYIELASGYTYLNLKFDQFDSSGRPLNNTSPSNQFNVRSSVQLPNDVEFDTALYYVGSVTPPAVRGIASYVRLDTKLTWKAMENLELSLVGQNLLKDHHREFGAFLYQYDSQIPRSVYGNITWKF